MCDAFVAALLRGDRAAALRQARRVLGEGGLAAVYEGLVTPALQTVGALWEQNRISVADEHLASAAADATIAALYPEVEWPPRGPKVLVAAVEGEQHCMAARMVADLLALDGWDDACLGANVPPEALAAKAQSDWAALVALSATLPARLPALRSAVRGIHQAAPRAKIMVGGRGLREVHSAAELEVDVIALSASDGVDAARPFRG
jgi:methanogenic corrinoid protein MtbC1